MSKNLKRDKDNQMKNYKKFKNNNKKKIVH